MITIDQWQHLPENISPVAFSIGPFSVYWYSLSYIVGLFVVYLLLYYRIKKGEAKILQNCQKSKDDNTQKKSYPVSSERKILLDMIVILALGMIIGARLGYVLIYNFTYFINNPWEVFLPIKVGDEGIIFEHLRGMSYFGGLAGVIISGWFFARTRRIDFWKLAQFIVPAAPAGFFVGRIGNFLNGELYGRATDLPWGMYFPSDFSGHLRHPSQIYEALLEGLLLFCMLWFCRKKSFFNKHILSIYLAGYAVARFGCEYFREPDQNGLIKGLITNNQVLSLFLFLISLLVFWREFLRVRKKI